MGAGGAGPAKQGEHGCQRDLREDLREGRRLVQVYLAHKKQPPAMQHSTHHNVTAHLCYCPSTATTVGVTLLQW